MMTTQQLEWTGSALGLLGAFLVATHSTWADYGFIVYVISNAFLIAFALKKKLFGILTMQVGFTVSSVLGIVTAQF